MEGDGVGAEQERVSPLGRGEQSGLRAGAGFEQVITARRAEADEFYAALTPAGTSAGAQR